MALNDSTEIIRRWPSAASALKSYIAIDSVRGLRVHNYRGAEAVSLAFYID